MEITGTVITNEEKLKETTEITGQLRTCAHYVNYGYEIEDIEITDELKSKLEDEAMSRSTEMIIEGNVSGELNCVWNGEIEIRGWWQIT